jgi:hypothetical protein
MGAATNQQEQKDQAALDITLDLPIPPSVNRLRRIDWSNHIAHKQWRLRTDLFVSAHGPADILRQLRSPDRKGPLIAGAYELRIQIPESLSGIDLGNHDKAIIDYLVSREFVANDSPRYLRRIVIEYGSPTPACHITIKARVS